MEDGIVYYKKDLDIFVYLEPITVSMNEWCEYHQNVLAIGKLIDKKDAIVEIYVYGNPAKEDVMTSYVKDKRTSDYLIIRPYVYRGVCNDYNI